MLVIAGWSSVSECSGRGNGHENLWSTAPVLSQGYGVSSQMGQGLTCHGWQMLIGHELIPRIANSVKSIYSSFLPCPLLRIELSDLDGRYHFWRPSCWFVPCSSPTHTSSTLSLSHCSAKPEARGATCEPHSENNPVGYGWRTHLYAGNNPKMSKSNPTLNHVPQMPPIRRKKGGWAGLQKLKGSAPPLALQVTLDVFELRRRDGIAQVRRYLEWHEKGRCLGLGCFFSIPLLIYFSGTYLQHLFSVAKDLLPNGCGVVFKATAGFEHKLWGFNSLQVRLFFSILFSFLLSFFSLSSLFLLSFFSVSFFFSFFFSFIFFLFFFIFLSFSFFFYVFFFFLSFSLFLSIFLSFSFFLFNFLSVSFFLSFSFFFFLSCSFFFLVLSFSSFFSFSLCSYCYSFFFLFLLLSVLLCLLHFSCSFLSLCFSLSLLILSFPAFFFTSSVSVFQATHAERSAPTYLILQPLLSPADYLHRIVPFNNEPNSTLANLQVSNQLQILYDQNGHLGVLQKLRHLLQRRLNFCAVLIAEGQ